MRKIDFLGQGIAISSHKVSSFEEQAYLLFELDLAIQIHFHILSFELGARYSFLPAFDIPSFNDHLTFWQGSGNSSEIHSALYVPISGLSEFLLEPQ